jgi:hypothetical protein
MNEAGEHGSPAFFVKGQTWVSSLIIPPFPSLGHGLQNTPGINRQRTFAI